MTNVRSSMAAMVWFLALAFVAAAAGVGWIVAGLVPPSPKAGEPALHRGDYRLVRKASEPLVVDDAQWLAVPFLFADFDLTFDIELGEGVDVDVLMRQVEPRYVQEVKQPFAGRFTSLRLSTNGRAAPWRSRDEALFGPRRGGVDLAAGHVATVWVQGRGRLLRANVAGRWLPWQEASDEYGMFTVIARGGRAALRSFVVENRGQPRAWLWSRWTWAAFGALCGAVLLAGALAEGQRLVSLVVAGLLSLLLAWLLVRGQTTDLALPAPGGLAGLVAGILLALAEPGVLRPFGRWLGLALALVGGSLLQRDDGRVEQVFGPRSCSMPSEALAQRVRGPTQLHTLAPATRRVFLLGGQLLYDRAGPEHHLAPSLRTELLARLPAATDPAPPADRDFQPLDVPCLSTDDGHALQQWRLFATFFTAYRPQVLVFGVPRDEAVADPRTGQPRSSPAQLADAVRQARQHQRDQGGHVVLFTEHDLPGELMAVLRAAAAEGAPLVVAGADEAPRALAERLAAAILPLLR